MTKRPYLLERAIRPFAAAVVLLLACPACLQVNNEDDDDDACSVSENAEGDAVLTCPDGSSVVIATESGSSSLLRSSSEAPGGNCPEGGVRIEGGLDEDGDGTLDDEEVSSTALLCHGKSGGPGANGEDGADGVDGEDGALVLVSLSSVPAGEDCEQGGQRLEAGRDLDGDGALDDDEVEATATVCHGEPGAPSLVRTLDEPAGERCPAGGTLLQSGLDLDGDGALGDDEVSDEAVVCHGEDGLSSCFEPGVWSGFTLGYVDGTPYDGPTLVSVDPLSGALSTLATTSASLGGLVYDELEDVIFATTREASPRLVTVALDGTLTTVGVIADGSLHFTALALDPFTRTLLALEENPAGEYRLFSLSRSTGAATLVRDLDTTGGIGWAAMAVGPDCRVYATLGTALYSLDPLTGAATLVAELGNYVDGLVYDGTLAKWLGYTAFEGGYFITFEHGTFTPQTLGDDYNGFEVRALTRVRD